MPVTGTGWELHLQRLGMHKSGSLQRTYGKYQVHINGSVVESLTGFIGERLGPGDNIRRAFAGAGSRFASDDGRGAGIRWKPKAARKRGKGRGQHQGARDLLI